MHRDASWDPPPVRGSARLTAQFLLTVVYAPVHWVLCAALALVVIACGVVLELISWIPGVEAGLKKLVDVVFGVVPFWPRWFVTLPELRHEGDTDFYRARVHHELSGSGRPVNTRTRALSLPLRKYRAVGAGYVVRTAPAHNWTPDPGNAYDPRREVELLRPV
ncbi:hypothetical protein [Streptomyces sp. NPDC050504]|uniref:hypothetical protein n=1 Tax=Streptomyces sp. NPDC050504 TaxID=3365618 RepID=UPI0037A471CC